MSGPIVFSIRSPRFVVTVASWLKHDDVISYCFVWSSSEKKLSWPFQNGTDVFLRFILRFESNDFDWSDEVFFWKLDWTKLYISSRLELLRFGSETELKIDEVLVATRVPDCDLSNRTKENTVMRFGQTITMTMVDKLLVSIRYIIIYEPVFVHDESLFLRKSWINLINQNYLLTWLIWKWTKLYVLIGVRVPYFVNKVTT